MGSNVRTHRDLDVYKRGFALAMELFGHSKTFPPEERYALISQIRRSSRSVCANITEGWHKRRYENSWVSKITDAEAEAAETQTHIEFAVACGYIPKVAARDLYRRYEAVIRTLVGMALHSDDWVIRDKDAQRAR